MTRWALVLLVLLVGCGAETTDAPDVPGQTRESTKAAFGEPITLTGNQEGVEVKVTPTRFIDPLQGGEFDKPQGENRFVGVELLLENTGDTTYNGSPSTGAQLILRNDEQADTKHLTGGRCGRSFASGLHLAEGDRRRGCVAFEVPSGVGARSFQFNLESGAGPTTGVWQRG
jgi:hypothetical protein